MKIFLVNNEFGVRFASTTFCLHNGDIVWVNSKNGDDYIFKAEYTYTDFSGVKNRRIFNIPVNLNSGGFCYRTFKMMSIKHLTKESYITDITTQYNRDIKISELWKNLEVEI